MAIPCRIVTVEGEANIIATDITAPVKVKTGETISGRATFLNVGTAEGSELCRVEANGTKIISGTLALAPGLSGNLNYSFPAEGTGTITICPYPNP